VLQRGRALVLAAQLAERGVDVREDAGVDLRALHVRHRADGEFAGNFGGDDGLGAGGGEGAFDAVDAEGGVAPARHEGGLLGGVDGGRGAEGFVQVVHCEGDVTVEALLLLRQRRHHLVDARDLDLPVCIDQAPQHADQVRHRLLRRAAENTAVEILPWAGDGHAVVVAAAEAVGQTRFFGSQPIVITDTHRIRILEEPTLLSFLLDELVEAFGTVFLHAFETHQQIDGELHPGFLVRLNGVQPAQDGALVVGAATPVHPALVVDG